jgi:hypothetical protein
MLCQEYVADNFRLLLEAIKAEWFARFEAVVVAAKGMAHQRQVETSTLLRLPDMRQLVDEIKCCPSAPSPSVAAETATICL